mgnify:FL=1|uniref:Putative ovule protein n=1 Tax=Solanum chacoense TaxID=4108 RepID=A0A0V0H2Z5_SOLCH
MRKRVMKENRFQVAVEVDYVVVVACDLSSEPYSFPLTSRPVVVASSSRRPALITTLEPKAVLQEW